MTGAHSLVGWDTILVAVFDDEIGAVRQAKLRLLMADTGMKVGTKVGN